MLKLFFYVYFVLFTIIKICDDLFDQLPQKIALRKVRILRIFAWSPLGLCLIPT